MFGLPKLPDGHNRDERQSENLDQPDQGFNSFFLQSVGTIIAITSHILKVGTWSSAIVKFMLDISVVASANVNKGSNHQHDQDKRANILDGDAKVPPGCRLQLDTHLFHTSQKLVDAVNPTNQNELKASYEDGIVGND